MSSINRKIFVADNPSRFLYQHVKDIYESSIKSHNRFTVAISGGSLPKTLSENLVLNKKEFDWAKWHIFYADERCVAHDSPDSNHRLVVEHLVKHVSIPASQVHSICPDLVDTPEEAAEEYQKQLVNVFGETQHVPQFDLILLGIGPDGHTCSLFPDHRLLNENKKWVTSLTDSPKPPPSRITLTFPILNHAHVCTFVVTGNAKSQTLVDILEKGVKLPAAMVSCKNVNWILDQSSASLLKCTDVQKV